MGLISKPFIQSETLLLCAYSPVINLSIIWLSIAFSCTSPTCYLHKHDSIQICLDHSSLLISGQLVLNIVLDIKYIVPIETYIYIYIQQAYNHHSLLKYKSMLTTTIHSLTLSQINIEIYQVFQSIKIPYRYQIKNPYY